MRLQIAQAVSELDEQLIEAQAWIQVLNEPENPPAWVFPVARMIDRIDSKSQALQELLNAEGQREAVSGRGPLAVPQELPQ